jgi:hypothetical protein
MTDAAPAEGSVASPTAADSRASDQGIAIPRSATLVDLERAIRGELGFDGRPFTLVVARARYGPSASGAPNVARARRELRALTCNARRDLALWARLRGFASLRSVRGAAGA